MLTNQYWERNLFKFNANTFDIGFVAVRTLVLKINTKLTNLQRYGFIELELHHVMLAFDRGKSTVGHFHAHPAVGRICVLNAAAQLSSNLVFSARC